MLKIWISIKKLVCVSQYYYSHFCIMPIGLPLGESTTVH